MDLLPLKCSLNVCVMCVLLPLLMMDCFYLFLKGAK